MAEWVEDEPGRDNMISLGFGTFFSPLPAGWTLEPGPPLTGDLVWPRGERLAYSLDCYEDAEAAAGGERLVDLATEEAYGPPDTRANGMFDHILIQMPVEREDPRPIVFKSLEPFAGTHVRVIRLALPADPEIDRRALQAAEIATFLQFGKWAHDRTRLDELAHTATLRRETFGESLLMRVPRDWRTQEVEEYRYAVEPPDEAETLWVSFQLFMMRPMIPEVFDVQVSSVEEGAREMLDPGDQLLETADERLGEFDHLARSVITEEDKQGPLRRITWRRYSWSEDIYTIALIHLCTDLDRIDEPRFVDSAALIEREVRNAAVIPLRPGR